MSDWPSNIATPTHINSFMRCVVANCVTIGGIFSPSAIAWGTSNMAAFFPLILPVPYTVRRLFWVNGTTASGHNDIGIYSPRGGRIYSSGSVVAAGVSAFQYVTPANPILLAAGQLYFLAFSTDTGTANRLQASASVTAVRGRQGGFAQMATAFPLPSPAVLAAWDGTSAKLPLIGITRTASGF